MTLAGESMSLGEGARAHTAPSPERGRRPRTLRFGLIIVGGIALVGILAPILPLAAPNQQDLSNALASPSTTHWLGTDALGRDMLSRTVFAIRVNLPVVLVAGLIPAVLGTVVGAISGFSHRYIDAVLMRVADAVQAFPVSVLLLVLVFTLGQGAQSFIVAATLVGWVAYARLIRAEVLRVKELDFVLAAQSAGLPRRRVLARHILPNTIGRSFVFLMSDLVLLIVALASLSYLGAGIPPPDPEWGRMIVEHQVYLRTHWWLVVVPGACIMLLGIGLSLVGDGLDEWLGQS